MTVLQVTEKAAEAKRVANERHSQRIVTAFVVSGMLFMLLPGTFLGVWNLIGISEHRTLSSISPAWLQAHGLAQIFGWVGSFIIGIGFYSLTKMQSTRWFPVFAGWIVWVVWTIGAGLRWVGGVTDWHWKILLPVSGVLELAAYIVFFASLRRHRPANAGQRKEPWMLMIVAASVAFAMTLAVNCVAMFWLALTGQAPALPHVFDEQFVLLALWGVFVPTIWGFNTRWLPIFAGFRKPSRIPLALAYGFSLLGLIAIFARWLPVAAVAFLFASVLAVDALHVWQSAVGPAKLLHVNRWFPLFIRITYVWLVVSALLMLIAVPYDHAGGIWGAGRHALTVGFVAGMVFAIGQRVLPAFCGMRVLWSTQLMFWSLLLLHAGCLLRVAMEPLAYEGYWSFAWKLLPISAFTELAAVALFALNIFGTLLRPPAHLRGEAKAVRAQGAA